jgi:RimJ/RimL family protein N-acetyltransferase
MNKSKNFLVITLINFIITGTSAYCSEINNSHFSDIFCFEDALNAKGLHVDLLGDDFQVEDIKNSHIPFYQDIFANEKVMKKFGDGQVRDRQKTKERCESSINDRFAQGHPHGFLTVIDPSTHLPFMNIIAGGGDRKGTSEIAYVIDPSYQGKKFGKKIVTSIVNQWAPEVRRIGLGTNLNNESQQTIINAFKCFGGEVLNQLDATSSPSNIPSWKILDYVGFSHAVCDVDSDKQETIINYDGKEFSSERLLQYELMEKEILKLFNPTHNDTPLKSAKRYFMIDIDGKERTFSKHAQWDRIKYHLEKKMDDEKKA